jgi:hypothetical protein
MPSWQQQQQAKRRLRIVAATFLLLTRSRYRLTVTMIARQKFTIFLLLFLILIAVSDWRANESGVDLPPAKFASKCLMTHLFSILPLLLYLGLSPYFLRPFRELVE